MGCGISSGISDISSEHDNNEIDNKVNPLPIIKKELDDKMVPVTKAYVTFLMNLLFETSKKWNYHIDETPQLKTQIENMLMTYLLRHNYYSIKYDSDIHYYKAITTKTDLCNIFEKLHNYGGCIYSTTDDTCSCLIGLFSLLGIKISLSPSMREYPYTRTYINDPNKSSVDHIVRINLIKLDETG